MANNNGITQLANLLRQCASDGVDASSPATVTPLSLISLDPIVWRKGAELTLPSSCVILPNGISLDKTDLNKSYMFLQANRGQRFYFLYERG